MARNRQRAKQRQAERRARRLSEEGNGDAQLIDDPTAVDPSPAVSPELAVGAPPTDEGRSDTVMDDEPPATEDEALREIDDWEVEGSPMRPREPAKRATRFAGAAGARKPRRTGTALVSYSS